MLAMKMRLLSILDIEKPWQESLRSGLCGKESVPVKSPWCLLNVDFIGLIAYTSSALNYIYS